MTLIAEKIEHVHRPNSLIHLIKSVNVFVLFLIASSDLWSNNNINNGQSHFLITFNNGSAEYSNQTPSNFNFNTTHQQKFKDHIYDGMFGFVNTIPNPYDTWHTGELDHTPNDEKGYMYLISLDKIESVIFNSTVDKLCNGRCYEFSAYLANIGMKSDVYIEPNLRFEVRDAANQSHLLASLITGDIPECDTMAWSKYSVSFAPLTSSVVLLMISTANSTLGNDLAIDDIELRVSPIADSCSCSSG